MGGDVVPDEVEAVVGAEGEGQHVAGVPVWPWRTGAGAAGHCGGAAAGESLD